MAEKYKIDLMHLQNELLGDLKNVENKMDSKIKKSNQVFEENKITVERRLNYLENAYTALLQRNQNSDNNNSEEKEKEIISKIDLLKRKSEENYFRLENKINDLKNELKDVSYKFDKKFSESFQIPGLIGNRAPFQNIREFLENINRKLAESLKGKDQQGLDLKKFKEKIDNALSSNKNQIEMLEKIINNKLDLQINDLDKKFDEKCNIIEERINTMRVENGKYSYDLLSKTNDLTDKCNRIDEVLKKALDEYNSEFVKYRNTFKKMNEKLIKFEEQYNLFEDQLKIIKEQFLVNNKYNSNYTNLEYRIKELEKMLFTMRSENKDSIFDENKNKSNFKANNNLNENEKHSFFTQKQIKKPELFNFNKDIKNISTKNLSKKEVIQYSRENAKEQKINNIIYDSKILKNPMNSRNYLNDLDKASKSKNTCNRINSGKIFNRFPFISYDRTCKNEDIINILKRNNTRDLKQKKLWPKEKIIRYKEEMNKLTIDPKNHKIHEKNKTKESEEFNNISNHNYKYLDKKIDILGKAMVDTFKKILSKMNNRKNNNNNDETNKTIKTKNNEENKSNLDDSKKNINNLNESLYDKKRNSKSLRNSNSFHLNLDLKIKSKLIGKSELLNKRKT